MLACLPTVCSKTRGDGVIEEEGKLKTEHEPSKNCNGSFFSCQFKQMASRLAGGSFTKFCKPACGTESPSALPDDNFSVHAATDEMHSPQFSLKSYQMNGQTPPRQDLIGVSEVQFNPGQASPKALRSLQQNFADADPLKFEPARAALGGSGYKGYSSEWVAQVDPGVYITFCTAPDGLNDLKRIKFSRAMFSKQHAENWWKENCPRIRGLYNVRPPTSTSTMADDDRFSSGYATPDAHSKSPCSSYNGGDYLLTRRKSSADARLKENDFETGGTPCNSWIEQDEAGVYLTVITVPGVGKQLKRIRFSREVFSEVEAAAWWEQNRQRIYAQYIFTNTRLQSK